jgi:preprotein translocase subunit SecA
MEKLGMEDGEPIENALISRSIENAQAKVEGHNFEIRKQLLEYDDVMNQQREVIYQQRREALRGEDLKDDIEEMIYEKAEAIAQTFADDHQLPEDWDFKAINDAVFQQFNFRLPKLDSDTLDGLTADGLSELIAEESLRLYSEKEAAIGAADFRQLERIVMLQVVDNLWKDHLLSMDHLKEGIGLRGYAQQNPLIVYKKEGFEMFNEMIGRVKEETLGLLFRVQIAESENIEAMRQPKQQNMVLSHGDANAPKKPVQRKGQKVGRNEPCPCGSGKKFKKCCGK